MINVSLSLTTQQRFSAGVGNSVADEVLYQPRIHPDQPAGGLSPAQIVALYDALKYVVNTTADAGANSTKLPRDWLFHYRWKKGKTGQL
ncbi:MAG: hypothetical protein MI717_15160 [Spirochaetales bacterium]|nr:hypothetical protein [Spirochaetales bacterium]